MSKSQILLLILAIIPLANLWIEWNFARFRKMVLVINKIFPLIFLSVIIALYRNFAYGINQLDLNILEFSQPFSFSLTFDKIAFAFLILLNFLWLIYTFHQQKFSFLTNTKLGFNHILAIALNCFLIISGNLITLLFFYSAIAIFNYFFVSKIELLKEEAKEQGEEKKQNKNAKLIKIFTHFQSLDLKKVFNLLLCFELIFLFLATAATYKYGGDLRFIFEETVFKTNVFSKLEIKQVTLLFVLFFGGLFFSVLIPSYLFYNRATFNLNSVYNFCFLSYSFSSLFVLIRVLFSVFGFKEFSAAIAGINLELLELIFLFNIITLAVFLVFSKDFKSLFFYLFFSQLIFEIFQIIFFAIHKPDSIIAAISSFTLSMTLIFICLSNIMIFLNKSESKATLGLFFELKITTILLVFSVANLAGFAPSIGMIEKYSLIKILAGKSLILPEIIFTMNLIILIIFSWKLLYPLFLRHQLSQTDSNLAKDIDFDSSLILSALVIALAMISILGFFIPITKFFSL